MKEEGSPIIGLALILFLVFALLKMFGQLAWSWWWITAPLWIPAGLWALVVAFIFVVMGFIALTYKD